MQGAEAARHNTPASPTFTMGWSASGFPQQPWVMDAFAPAGGVRATIVDMAKYAQALLAGNLAGSEGMHSLFATDDPDLPGGLCLVHYPRPRTGDRLA